MSYPMRRKDRQQDENFCLSLIDRCTHGVMALQTDEQTPYCLPLSFARAGRSLYFHCAAQGRKLEMMRQNPRVCVTFVEHDIPTYVEDENNFTTMFASAIVTGTAVEVTEDEERLRALDILCRRFLPEAMVGDNFSRAIESSLPRTGVWRIDMDELTGKLKV